MYKKLSTIYKNHFLVYLNSLRFIWVAGDPADSYSLLDLCEYQKVTYQTSAWKSSNAHSVDAHNF